MSGFLDTPGFLYDGFLYVETPVPAMAAMPLSEIRTLTRHILHEYSLSHGTFWDDTVLDNFINLAYRYYMLLIERFDPGRFVQALSPIDVKQGIDSYTVQARGFAFWAIFWKPDVVSFEVWKGPRYTHPHSQSQATPNFDTTPAYVPKVRKRGNTIVLSPPPQQDYSGALIPEVIAFPPKMVLETDIPDNNVHPIFHPLIACRAAYVALAEDGTDISQYSGLVQTLNSMEQQAIGILTGRFVGLEEAADLKTTIEGDKHVQAQS